MSGHAFLFFFFKQKTAYEMRISDWSSDVCSSDLLRRTHRPARRRPRRAARVAGPCVPAARRLDRGAVRPRPPDDHRPRARLDRKSVVSGKSVSVRVDIGGRRIIKKKLTTK